MTQPRLHQVRSQCGASFSCSPTERVLIAMERAGVKCVPVGCRGGGCGICKVRVLSGEFTAGKMSAAHITAEEAQDNYVLACQLYPRSDILIETMRKPGQR